MRNFKRVKQDKVIKLLKNILKNLGIKIYKVILFGSRARNNSTSYSDYDFLIVVNQSMSLAEKRRIASFIRMRMAEEDTAVDIFLKDVRDYEVYKNIVGSLPYDVEKEGIVV